MDVQDHTARRIDDDALTSCLARVLGDPPPPHLGHVAVELYTWRTVDAELADLLRAPLPAD